MYFYNLEKHVSFTMMLWIRTYCCNIFIWDIISIFDMPCHCFYTVLIGCVGGEPMVLYERIQQA